jgi:hypothetical protein
MNQEAVILSKHNLDVSNIDILANDLASRLNLNIEFGHYDFKNNSFNLYGAITNDPKEPFFKLFPQNNDHPDEVNFVLELGEGAHVIYKEILNLILPFPLEYDDLYEEHKSNPKGLFSDGLLKNWLDELLKLGADEIYFISDFGKPGPNGEHYDEKKYSWSEYKRIIISHFTYFIEPKQLILNQ